jgi:hypothetical protein
VNLPDVLGHFKVLLLIAFVQEDKDEVEPRKKCGGEVDVFMDGLAFVVPSEERVGSCQN